MKPKYTKEQLITSNKFRDYRDVLKALLDDDKKYSFKQAENIINEFLKGKVD